LLLTKRRLETSFRNDKKEFFGRWYFNKNVSPSKIGFLLQSQTISLLPVLLSSPTPLGDFGNSSFPQFSWFNRRKKNLFKKAKTSFQRIILRGKKWFRQQTGQSFFLPFLRRRKKKKQFVFWDLSCDNFDPACCSTVFWPELFWPQQLESIRPRRNDYLL
jgi:hypothetical protein